MVLVVSTFMLDFPWSMSCVVELCAIARLAPGGLVATISLVREFFYLDAQLECRLLAGLDLHF